MRNRLAIGLAMIAAGEVLLRRKGQAVVSPPKKIAPSVWWLEIGRGLTESNVYFVRAGSEHRHAHSGIHTTLS